MKIRALAIHEPWATLIRLGKKKLEARQWRYPITFGGPLLITATKTVDWRMVRVYQSECLLDVCPWNEPLLPEDFEPLSSMAVATANIVGSRQMVDGDKKDACFTHTMSTEGHIVIKLSNVVPIKPFLVRNRQKFFWVDYNNPLQTSQGRTEFEVPDEMVLTGPRVVHAKHEPYHVYIGRPSIWGNPFSHLPGKGDVQVNTPEEAVLAYRDWLLQARFEHINPQQRQQVLSSLYQLEGKTLGCWCKRPNRRDAPCHGDVLLSLVEGDLRGLAETLDQKEERAGTPEQLTMFGL